MRIVKSGFILNFVLACTFLVFVGCAATAEQDAVISLDTSETYQTMTGWELTGELAGAPAEPRWTPYKEELLDKLISEGGINRVRLEIRNSAEAPPTGIAEFINGEINYKAYREYFYSMENDNDDPFVIDPDGFNFLELDWHIEETVIPMRQRLEARGEKLWVNVNYVAFIQGDYPLKDPEEYAEFVLATYQHMDSKYGFLPDTWEVILEPDQKRDMWSGREIGEAIVAAGKRLEVHGYSPSFVAPSTLNMAFAVPYMQEIEKVPGAVDYMSELSYHRYSGRKAKNAIKIAQMADKHGLKTGMLEYWFGKATYDMLHEDLRLANNSSWQGEVVYGMYKLVTRDDGSTELRINEAIRHHVQYFRHVRIGAQRVGARVESGSGVDPLAFINPDGSTTMVIKAKRATRFTLNDLPAGAYEISYALPERSEILPDRIEIGADEPLTTRIPNKGVITITSRVDPSDL